ncbi:hypothetical protein ACJVC5_17605 [Peredibacter sp. HCB2-198]|uniref:hypothetical protein n=1 Tax=Peredibacter sp. HCB2-198 TaxID=3383025 RepID=UPI0038B58DFF
MKKTSIILSTALLVSACSKTVKEVTQVQEKSSQSEVSNKTRPEPAKDVSILRELLNSKAPNLALAELLAKSVVKEHREELKAMITELSEEEAEQIIKSLDTSNNTIRENYLYHGQKYYNGKKLESSLILDGQSLKNHPFSLETQLKISTISYLKSKALDNILEAYNKRSEKLAIELAQDIAFEIGSKHPDVARQIENEMNGPKDKVIEAIRKATPVAKKIDQYFRTSELNENEQYVTLLGGLIAGAIYVQVKDNKGFRNLIAQGQKIARDIKEFEEKAKEFSVLVNTMKHHLEQTKNDYRNLQEGMIGARDDARDLFERIRTNDLGPSDVSSRRIVDFLYKRVIKGEEASPDRSNPSVLSKQVSFNENFQKTLTSASSLTNNLSGIIHTANSFATLFKMRPSKDLANILDKAQKVNAVIQGVQSAVAGFAAGGFIGAMGAISSGPMMSLMGGGSRDSAMLAEINKKLDIVIKNQQEMMKMQIETMNMLKDLALMVDIYHQQEMAAIAELRDYQLTNLEISKAQLNKDIRSCERMINFQLSSVWKNMDFGRDAFHSINNLEILKLRFTQSITGLHDIRRIVNSVEEDGFKNCQSGIAEAFGSNNYNENPIRSIYASDEQNNLYQFHRETYAPLLSSLEYFSGTSSFDSMPLHLPTREFAGLKFKVPHIDNARTESSSNDIYDLDQLLSVKNLERYLSHLIVLLPLMEVDKNVWLKSYEEIVASYLDASNFGSNQNIRSHFFLTNALKLTQSAIAQEALLAGEPVLHQIHARYIKDIMSDKECAQIKRDDVPATAPETTFLCSVRGNRLLLKNLVMFALHSESEVHEGFMEKYKTAYEASDRVAMAKLLNAGIAMERIEAVKSRDGSSLEFIINVLDKNKSKVAIKLPTPAALKEGKILYSESMSRLLKMQDMIINNLEKVAPVERNQAEDLLKLLMVGA